MLFTAKKCKVMCIGNAQTQKFYFVRNQHSRKRLTKMSKFLKKCHLHCRILKHRQYRELSRQSNCLRRDFSLSSHLAYHLATWPKIQMFQSPDVEPLKTVMRGKIGKDRRGRTGISSLNKLQTLGRNLEK